MRPVAAAILALVLASAAAAQDSAFPRLGDHLFTSVTALTDPFITTDVQTTVSLGQTVNARIPVYDLVTDEIIGHAASNLALAGIGFRYQHAAKDWLAVRVGLNAAGRLGTSTTTLIADGVTGTVGYSVGWKVRAFRSRKVILTGSVGLGNQSTTFINLLDWAGGLIEGTNVPLVRPRHSLRGSGGVEAGWGISRRFGLLGSLGAVYGESFDGRGLNDWTLDGRLALSCDLEHDLGIPLGLALAGGHYDADELGANGSGVLFWSVRIAAHGRKDFTLGLEIRQSYLESPLYSDDLHVAQVSIDMRYFY